MTGTCPFERTMNCTQLSGFRVCGFQIYFACGCSPCRRQVAARVLCRPDSMLHLQTVIQPCVINQIMHIRNCTKTGNWIIFYALAKQILCKLQKNDLTGFHQTKSPCFNARTCYLVGRCYGDVHLQVSTSASCHIGHR